MLIFVHHISRVVLFIPRQSFQRQLHLWKFTRIAHGEDGGAYFNRFFLRDQPDQCKYMCREKIKGMVENQEEQVTSSPGGTNSVASSSTTSTRNNIRDLLEQRLELLNFYNTVKEAQNARLLSTMLNQDEQILLPQRQKQQSCRFAPFNNPSPVMLSTCSFTSGRVSKARTIAPIEPAAPMAATSGVMLTPT